MACPISSVLRGQARRAGSALAVPAQFCQVIGPFFSIFHPSGPLSQRERLLFAHVRHYVETRE
jgi:hypothetical protein